MPDRRRSCALLAMLALWICASPPARAQPASGVRFSMGPNLTTNKASPSAGVRPGGSLGLAYHWQPLRYLALRPRLAVSFYHRSAGFDDDLTGLFYYGPELLGMASLPLGGRAVPYLFGGPRLYRRFGDLPRYFSRVPPPVEKNVWGIVVGVGIEMERRGNVPPFSFEVRFTPDLSDTYDGTVTIERPGDTVPLEEQRSERERAVELVFGVTF